MIENLFTGTFKPGDNCLEFSTPGDYRITAVCVAGAEGVMTELCPVAEETVVAARLKAPDMWGRPTFYSERRPEQTGAGWEIWFYPAADAEYSVHVEGEKL